MRSRKIPLIFVCFFPVIADCMRWQIKAKDDPFILRKLSRYLNVLNGELNEALNQTRNFIDDLRNDSRHIKIEFRLDCDSLHFDAMADQFQVKYSRDTRRDSWTIESCASNRRASRYSFYWILEHLGFAFHRIPIDVLPKIPSLQEFDLRLSAMLSAQLSYSERAYWNIRRWHVHTQHPLPLTDFLNGRDVYADRDATKVKIPWSDLIPQFEALLEWLLANYQNSLEWVLLRTTEESHQRFQRLKRIMELCREYAIECGVDVPLALIQQHSFTLVGSRNPGQMESNIRTTIENNIQWLLGDIGFDFISSENGLTEFNQLDCTKALQWMNWAASAVKQIQTKRGKSPDFPIKIHVSQNQLCVLNGTEFNFNFLPSFASDNVALLPHTVQVYGIHDHAPVYGNDNLTFMFDYMMSELNHNRSVIWYPETAYWVNFDIDVPLFLPVYAMTRFNDIRLIVRQEQKRNLKIAGQMIFESGWEIGYWLQNAMAARSAWNGALYHIHDDKVAFRRALANTFHPLTSNNRVQDALTLFFEKLIIVQHELLIAGSSTETGEKLAGMPYLVGCDTWTDLGSFFHALMATLPRRELTLNDVLWSRWNFKREAYQKQVRPLLSNLKQSFQHLHTEFETILMMDLSTMEWAKELGDSLNLFSIRASFIYHAYECVYYQSKEHLANARNNLLQADSLVRRLIPNLTGQWHPGSLTAYRFQHMWPARSLYYWLREYTQIDDSYLGARYGFCWMNRIHPFDILLGSESIVTRFTTLAQEWVNWLWPVWFPLRWLLLDCLSDPIHDPTLWIRSELGLLP